MTHDDTWKRNQNDTPPSDRDERQDQYEDIEKSTRPPDDADLENLWIDLGGDEEDE